MYMKVCTVMCGNVLSIGYFLCHGYLSITSVGSHHHPSLYLPAAKTEYFHAPCPKRIPICFHADYPPPLSPHPHPPLIPPLSPHHPHHPPTSNSFSVMTSKYSGRVALVPRLTSNFSRRRPLPHNPLLEADMKPLHLQPLKYVMRRLIGDKESQKRSIRSLIG